MLHWITEHLAVILFFTVTLLLFTGYPVAFVLGGVAIAFGVVGYFLDVFNLMSFFTLMPRIWGGVASNQIGRAHV